MQSHHKVVLTGIFTPADWGPNGECQGLNLATYDEEEYRVEDCFSKVNLWDLIHKPVTVIGTAEEDSYGRKILTSIEDLKRI